jgi:hypothetical protein
VGKVLRDKEGVDRMKAYEEQMRDWLEFAWANKNNPEFKTIQTARQRA